MKDRAYLHGAYNATCTEYITGSDELETYEHWLERQLLSRIERLEKADPSDEEVANWYDENDIHEASSSSAIYKFREWLKERSRPFSEAQPSQQ